jgi:chromosome segregation ATPase
MTAMGRRKKRSEAQKKQMEDCRQTRHLPDPQENSLSPEKSRLKRMVLNLSAKVNVLEPKAEKYKKGVRNGTRKIGRLEKKVISLQGSVENLASKLTAAEKARNYIANLFARYRHDAATKENETQMEFERLHWELAVMKEREKKREQMLKESRRLIRVLKAHVKRASEKHTKALEKAKANSLMRTVRLRQKGVYIAKARALVHLLVRNGCSKAKIGVMVRDIGKLFGLTIVDIMSRRTVSRIILEGAVAAKMQLGFEMAHTPGMF